MFTKCEGIAAISTLGFCFEAISWSCNDYVLVFDKPQNENRRPHQMLTPTCTCLRHMCGAVRVCSLFFDLGEHLPNKSAFWCLMHEIESIGSLSLSLCFGKAGDAHFQESQGQKLSAYLDRKVPSTNLKASFFIEFALFDLCGSGDLLMSVHVYCTIKDKIAAKLQAIKKPKTFST